MIVKATDTIFFYRIDETLRQAIEIQVLIPDEETSSLQVEIIAGQHGHCTTRIDKVGLGDNRFTAYAPVIYPNYIDGRLRPVLADLVISSSRDLYRGSVEIGRHRPWTVYVCQDICTDFTWGMPFDQTVKVSGNMIMAQLDYMKKTDHEKSISQNRWNMNQTVELDWFLANQPAENVQDLFAREKEERIEISATYNSNLTAMLGTEQAIRSLYFARDLWKKYGIRLTTLEHIEMPTISWGMMTIYAKAGIKYFIKHWLDFNSHYLKKCPDTPLFYWQGPDNSLILSFMDKGANLREGYGHACFLSGTFGKYTPSYATALEQLHGWWIPHYENNEAYPFDSFMLLGAYIDLHERSKSEIAPLVENIKQYNSESWEYPKLVNATWRQYFTHIEQQITQTGLPIPILRGDMGSSWEDWPAHYAHLVAVMKRGVENFIMAEKMVALAENIQCIMTDNCLDQLKEMTRLMNLLAEHPWNGSNEDEMFRSRDIRTFWINELNRRIGLVCQSFWFGLGMDCDHLPSTSIGIRVFNFMSWPRNGEVCLDIDSTCDLISVKNEPAYQMVEEFGRRYVSLFAVSVPAMGYNTACSNLAIVKDSAVFIQGNTIENSFYKLCIDIYDGSITSLWDKKNKYEFVNTTKQTGFNQYLYHSDGNTYKLHNIQIQAINCGPLRGSLQIDGDTLNSHISTIITLYSDLDKIMITNRVHKKPSSEPLNIYFAFPCNIPDRQYHYESTASIIRPGLHNFGGDQLPGAGQEIYSVRNFLDISNNDLGIVISPLDSYLFQLGGMTYDIMPDFPDPSNADVYALVMTNHAYKEILRDQGGQEYFEFRFSIQTHQGGFQPVPAMKFGWEENNQLVAAWPDETAGQIIKEPARSYLECLSDSVIVTAFKPAEDQDGYILRLWEIGGSDCIAQVNIAELGFTKAINCDIIERENGNSSHIENGILKVHLTASSIETIKLVR